VGRVHFILLNAWQYWLMLEGLRLRLRLWLWL
jgi:hypothetical protein